MRWWVWGGVGVGGVSVGGCEGVASVGACVGGGESADVAHCPFYHHTHPHHHPPPPLTLTLGAPPPPCTDATVATECLLDAALSPASSTCDAWLNIESTESRDAPLAGRAWGDDGVGR